MRKEIAKGWCKKCDREVLFEKKEKDGIASFIGFLLVTFLAIYFCGYLVGIIVGIIIGISLICLFCEGFCCIKCGTSCKPYNLCELNIEDIEEIEEEMMGGWCEDCDQEVMFFKKSFSTDFRCLKCGGIGRTVKLRTHRK